MINKWFIIDLIGPYLGECGMRFFFISMILISTFFIHTEYSYAVENSNIDNSVADNKTSINVVSVVATDNRTPLGIITIDNATDNRTPSGIITIDNATDNRTPSGVITIDNATDNRTPSGVITIDNATDNRTPSGVIAIDNATDNRTPSGIITIDNATDNRTPLGVITIDNATDNRTPSGIIAIDNATDNRTPSGVITIDNATDNRTDKKTDRSALIDMIDEMTWSNGFKLDRRGNTYLYLMLASGADADNYIARHFGGFFIGVSGGLQIFNLFAVELGFTFRQALLNQLEIKTAVFFQPVIPIGSRFEIVPRIGIGMINTFSIGYAESANNDLNANMDPFTNMLFVVGLRFNIDDRYIIGIIGENDIFGVSQRYRYGLEFGIKF